MLGNKRIKMDVNGNKNYRNSQKLNYTLMNDNWVNEEIKKKLKNS